MEPVSLLILRSHSRESKALNPHSDRLIGVEFRPAREHERLPFSVAESRGFSGHFLPQEGELEYRKIDHPLHRTVCAFEGDDIVGTTLWAPYELTVPGGKSDFFGVTDVTVLPTHTRRGILREMMRRLLIEGRDAGYPIAGLWASESNIYGRFGFGISGETVFAKIDVRNGRFRATPKVKGEIRFADVATMEKVAPVVWNRSAEKTIGMMLRTKADWDWIYYRRRIPGFGKRRTFCVVYREGTEALGYATYRIEHKMEAMHSYNTVRVIELVASTTAAEAALWRFLLDIDLAGEVVHHHPKKSKLLWLLADPRKLSLEPYDSLWIRILDPIKALTGRTYSAAGEVVIKLADEFCPWTQGTYALRVDSNGKAICEVTDQTPDLTLPVASLGAIYMGAHYLADLQRAGRAHEHRPGAVATVDSMFPTSGVHSFMPEF